MRCGFDRIMTTHVGSLPRPNELVELYRDDAPDNTLLPRLRSAVAWCGGKPSAASTFSTTAVKALVTAGCSKRYHRWRGASIFFKTKPPSERGGAAV